jgi:hypothetical protein
VSTPVRRTPDDPPSRRRRALETPQSFHVRNADLHMRLNNCVRIW